MANRLMKRCSTLLSIREIQINTTIKYHLTHLSEWLSSKRTQITNVGEDVQKMEPSYTWWECKSKQPLWKTVWRFLKKLKLELLCDPAVPLLGIYPNKAKNTNSKRFMHPNAHSSIIYNCQDMEAI